MSGMLAPTPVLALPAGSVDVWFLPLEGPDLGRFPLAAWLDDEERAHTRRMKMGAERWAAARGARRLVLSRYLGVPPGAVRFGRGPLGKPCLEGLSPVRFSASAREGMALLAVAGDRDLGVDLEHEDTARFPLTVARAFLAPIERVAIAAAPPVRRRHAFAQAWARHEALRKLHGLGVGDPLPRRSPGTHWFVKALKAPAGFAAAVATDAPGWQLRTRELSELSPAS